TAGAVATTAPTAPPSVDIAPLVSLATAAPLDAPPVAHGASPPRHHGARPDHASPAAPPPRATSAPAAPASPAATPPPAPAPAPTPAAPAADEPAYDASKATVDIGSVVPNNVNGDAVRAAVRSAPLTQRYRDAP